MEHTDDPKCPGCNKRVKPPILICRTGFGRKKPPTRTFIALSAFEMRLLNYNALRMGKPSFNGPIRLITRSLL